MKMLIANIEDVFREAAARWTLIAYFVLSSLFILLFALSVNLDIVNGAIAGAKLFGKDVDMRGAPGLEKLVFGFEGGFSMVIYVVGIFLAVFATAHLVPRMQEKGTVDLYLARPVGRVPFLLSRFTAGLLLAAANVAYLIGSIWLIIIWKTHVVHVRFLLGGAVILFAIAVLLAFAFLIGVITSSTAVSIMSSYAIFLASAILALHDKMEAAVSSAFTAGFIHVLYVVFPKTSELAQAVFVSVAGELAPHQMVEHVSATPFISSAIFGIVSLSLASWLFQRKEF